MKKAIQTSSILVSDSQNCQNLGITDRLSIGQLILIEQNTQKKCLLYETFKNHKLQRYTVEYDLFQLSQTVEIYEWRKSTDLPILKTYGVEVVDKSIDKISLNVYVQSYQFKLSELSNIPFHQIIYILKEAIIGFQRLFYRFGPFEIVSDMICINMAGQCKVWINPQFQLNKLYQSDVSQSQFAKNLIHIISEKVQKKNVSIKFFEELQKIQNMIEMLNFIEEYIKTKKLKVPSKYDQSNYDNLRRTVKRVFNYDFKISLNPVKQHKSLQKIKPISKRQFNCQENFEKLSYQSIFEQNKKNKKLVISTNNLNPNSQVVETAKTLKTSSNTTNSYTFKSKLNRSNQIDLIIQQKSNLSKQRKHSQNLLANSYQIFDIDEPQKDEQQTARWKYESNKNYSQKFIGSLNFKQTLPKTTERLEEKTELISDEQSQEQQLDTMQIFKKNGWLNKIDGIFNTTPLKQSVKIGKDQNILDAEYQFTILKPPGLVYQSILPEDFE